MLEITLEERSTEGHTLLEGDKRAAVVARRPMDVAELLQRARQPAAAQGILRFGGEPAAAQGDPLLGCNKRAPGLLPPEVMHRPPVQPDPEPIQPGGILR